MKYFKHETSDRNKLPSKLIRSKFGAEGYGIYNALLEVLGEEIDKHNSDDWGYVNEMHTIETLADECSTTPEKLKEFLKFCDEKQIFKKKNNKLYSDLILKRIDEYTTKLRRKSVSNPDKIRKSTDKIRSNRIEENRIEQNRKEKNGKIKKSAPPLDKKREELRVDGLSPTVPSTILGIDASSIIEPRANNGISKEWQDKAFRFAKHLGMTLSDKGLKARWLKFFRDTTSPKIDQTISYLVDYKPFMELQGDEARMKYFFQVFYKKT